jgi:hypothetical protein
MGDLSNFGYVPPGYPIDQLTAKTCPTHVNFPLVVACPPLALFVLIAFQAGVNADLTFTEQPKKLLLFSWLATLALHRLLP